MLCPSKVSRYTCALQKRTHWPMQLLGPVLKTLKLLCCCEASSASHLSGTKASGSGYTSVFRWMLYVGTLIAVPGGSLKPPNTVPGRVTIRSNPIAAVGRSRSVSYRTAFVSVKTVVSDDFGIHSASGLPGNASSISCWILRCRIGFLETTSTTCIMDAAVLSLPAITIAVDWEMVGPLEEHHRLRTSH